MEDETVERVEPDNKSKMSCDNPGHDARMGLYMARYAAGLDIFTGLVPVNDSMLDDLS